MHTIIDEITDVEAEAKQIRMDAVAAAKEATAAAREDGEKQIAAQAEFARAKLREAIQKAEAEGEVLAEDILSRRAAETAGACDAAKAKLPEAVKYLTGRVVNGE